AMPAAVLAASWSGASPMNNRYGVRRLTALTPPFFGKPAAEEFVDIAGAAVGDRVADVVRQAVIDPEFDVAQLAERLVIGHRADGLAAGNDDERRAGDPLHLVLPVVARHQQHEFGNIGRVVLGRL